MPSLDIKKTIADVRADTSAGPTLAQRCEICGQSFNPQNFPQAEYHRTPQHEPQAESSATQ